LIEGVMRVRRGGVNILVVFHCEAYCRPFVYFNDLDRAVFSYRDGRGGCAVRNPDWLSWDDRLCARPVPVRFLTLRPMEI